MNPLVRCPDVQIRMTQETVKAFVGKGVDTFESFLSCWAENDSSQIHAGSSPRPLVFSPCQTCYSTFLGFCRPEKRDLEKRAGVFGLYVANATQFCAYPAPILVSAQEMNHVLEFCRSDVECASIISYLLNSGRVIFSSFPVAIETKAALHPPAAVVDDRIASNKLFVTSRESGERRPPGDVEDISALSDQYQQLLGLIRGE
jgi:hypothetical protein